MAIEKVHYSCKPGFEQLKLSDIPAVKAEIKQIMGSNTTQNFTASVTTTQIFRPLSRKISRLFSSDMASINERFGALNDNL